MRRWKYEALLVCSMVTFALANHAPASPAAEWRAAHEREILGEFSDFLRLPNVAADSAGLERNAEHLQAMCARRGLAVQVLRMEGAPPLVVADLRVPGATRTVAFYAHYDGQPVDPARWQSDPWQPVMRDATGQEIDWTDEKAIDPEWRLYARGSGDDKGPIVALLAGLDALQAAKTKPAVNLRFVFEGEEESGSPHLAGYLTKNAAALQADGWILCDGPVHQSRRPLLYFGARGTVDLELTLYGPIRGLHDGHYGNWVPNPAVRLAHLLASMRDEQGRILIKGFAEDVRPPTEAERKALAKIPGVEAELRAEFQIAGTEGGGRPLNELLLQPALNVRGLEAGHVGAQATNTIPPEARASLDFRLVPAQTPESIQPLVEAHLRAQGYEVVREIPDAAARRKFPKLVRVQWGQGYPPARTALDSPLSREIIALLGATGREPVLLPTIGGSIPMYLFQQPGDTPAIGLPIANHDDNQHAADENLRLQNLWEGIEIFAALFAGLSAR